MCDSLIALSRHVAGGGGGAPGPLASLDARDELMAAMVRYLGIN